jgi:small conductance mechanosensitive channel
MNEIVERLNAYYHSFLRVLPRIGMAILVLIVGVIIVNWLTKIVRKKISGSSHDPLMSGFLTKAIKLILFVVLFLLALHIAGLSGIAGALLATAGASAIVLGFAFKDIAENFLAGIILAFNRPFHINDTVKIEDVFGKVKDMQFRYTKIATFDGRNVYIPNSDVLTKPVSNYTEDGFFRGEFVVGIAYENDVEEAKRLIRQCFEEDKEIVHDDDHINFVVEDELAASTVNLKVFFWVHTNDFRRGMLETRGKLIQKVKRGLEAAGFNLPADIREIKFYDASNPLKVYTQKTNGENGEAKAIE